MSMTCPCGGQVSITPLTQSREAWKCKACGRYEAVSREAVPAISTPTPTPAQEGLAL